MAVLPRWCATELNYHPVEPSLQHLVRAVDIASGLARLSLVTTRCMAEAGPAQVGARRRLFRKNAAIIRTLKTFNGEAMPGRHRPASGRETRLHRAECIPPASVISNRECWSNCFRIAANVVAGLVTRRLQRALEPTLERRLVTVNYL